MAQVSIGPCSPCAPRAVCCVCGEDDGRALVEVALLGGPRTTLCGSHALMHRRSKTQAQTVAELRRILGERRRRRDRRDVGDELGEALSSAFNECRRGADRRRTK
jgi:hypothetical protein